MRIPNFSNCGCEQRKQIMFTYGHLGVPEAAIVGLACLSLILAFKKGKA